MLKFPNCCNFNIKSSIIKNQKYYVYLTAMDVLFVEISDIYESQQKIVEYIF